jgi:hypothetical protein
MQYGFIISDGDIYTILEMAAEAEEAGWDGVFYWDGPIVRLNKRTAVNCLCQFMNTKGQKDIFSKPALAHIDAFTSTD